MFKVCLKLKSRVVHGSKIFFFFPSLCKVWHCKNYVPWHQHRKQTQKFLSVTWKRLLRGAAEFDKNKCKPLLQNIPARIGFWMRHGWSWTGANKPGQPKLILLSHLGCLCIEHQVKQLISSDAVPCSRLTCLCNCPWGSIRHSITVNTHCGWAGYRSSLALLFLCWTSSKRQSEPELALT